MCIVSDMSIAIIDDRLLISSCCKVQETQTSLDTTRCSIDGIDTSSFVFWLFLLFCGCGAAGNVRD